MAARCCTVHTTRERNEMAPQTYSEQSQRAYFTAAKQIWKVAEQVLDNMQNEVELSSMNGLEWAKSTAAVYARQAQHLETLGHERCIASQAREASLRRAHESYSDCVTRF